MEQWNSLHNLKQFGLFYLSLRAFHNASSSAQFQFNDVLLRNSAFLIKIKLFWKISNIICSKTRRPKQKLLRSVLVRYTVFECRCSQFWVCVRLIFHSEHPTELLNVLASQTKCGEMWNSAIFQMIIIMHVNVYGASYYTVIQIKS